MFNLIFILLNLMSSPYIHICYKPVAEILILILIFFLIFKIKKIVTCRIISVSCDNFFLFNLISVFIILTQISLLFF